MSFHQALTRLDFEKKLYRVQGRLVVQEDGDVNVMCGKFQENYLHSVSHVRTWQALLNQFGNHLDAWEKLAMQADKVCNPKCCSAGTTPCGGSIHMR